MRSTIIAAAFAAGAFAAPYSKRALVTDYDIDVVTAFVTVTAGQPSPTSAPVVANFVHQNNVLTTPAPVPQSTVVTVEQPQSDSSSSAQPSQDNSAPSVNAAPSVNSAPSAPASGSYNDMVLYHHNIHRANHSASDLTWDQGLADIATQIGQTCRFEHKMGINGVSYGQNIASGPAPENVNKVITNMFYDGEVNAFDGLYGNPDPTGDDFEAWGHFSQVVWKGTSSVGCATVDCSGPGLYNGGGASWFTVCNYGGPGNVGGQYAANIGSPIGNPTVYVN